MQIMKKIITFLLIFTLILSAQIAAANPEPTSARLDIVVTDLSDEVVNTAEIGDIIRVTVSMTEFRYLINIVPSLHFNPHVIRAVRLNPATNEFDPIPRERMARPWAGNSFRDSFFRLGPTMGAPMAPERWAGTISSLTTHPFVDNYQGLIGMSLDGPATADGGGIAHSLNGRQVIYYVYFEVIGSGDADIRLSRWADGPERRDGLITSREEYALVSCPIEIIRRSEVHEFAPIFRVPGPSIYTETGRIWRLSDINDGDQVRARIGEADVPSDARLIITVFDNGRFYGVHIGNNEETNFVRMPTNIRTSEIRVFVWNDLGSMTCAFPPLIIDR